MSGTESVDTIMSFSWLWNKKAARYHDGGFKVFCFKPLQCLLRPRDFRGFKRFRKRIQNTFPGQPSSQSNFLYIWEKIGVFSIIFFYSILDIPHIFTNCLTLMSTVTGKFPVVSFVLFWWENTLWYTTFFSSNSSILRPFGLC